MDTLNKILRLIKLKGITEKEFTQQLGISVKSVTEWKNGTTKTFQKHIDKIAKYFNVSTDYLLGNAYNPMPSASESQENDGTYILVIAKTGTKKYPVPREEVERFNKMVELILPGLLEDDKNSDL